MYLQLSFVYFFQRRRNPARSEWLLTGKSCFQLPASKSMRKSNWQVWKCFSHQNNCHFLLGMTSNWSPATTKTLWLIAFNRLGTACQQTWKWNRTKKWKMSQGFWVSRFVMQTVSENSLQPLFTFRNQTQGGSGLDYSGYERFQLWEGLSCS